MAAHGTAAASRVVVEGGWFVALQGQISTADSESNGVTFSTLHELILSVHVLKLLFPQTPKGVTFTLHSQVQKEAQA
ncbi:unnamed protein product [Peronospora destructor]|uniref:Uncharacterized protein n=1 Tax=Peronospora destructor TaxID=86335 RepID=A0AAV0V442_9STRA|nr:unnamed protein product [Peronospora destructor]